jgi:hypothetical protein
MTPWLIYCDRAWGNARAGGTAILISPSRMKQRYAHGPEALMDGDTFHHFLMDGGLHNIFNLQILTRSCSSPNASNHITKSMKE